MCQRTFRFLRCALPCWQLFATVRKQVLRLCLASLLCGTVSAAPQPRDPTRSPSQAKVQLQSQENPAATESAAALQLTLIRLRGKRPVAWINDRPVTIGDLIEDAKVLAIDTRGVTLLRAGQAHRLLLAPDVSIKRPAVRVVRKPHPLVEKPSP
ncbi:hypothetical protein ACUHMQ_17555 [Chitinimonas sp. PSY-7]|uniref:hypothetical protein n=1 Tax=Chitinimonas sp. PSY-7 TaxID=3459088 RepID=UPI0040401DE7